MIINKRFLIIVLLAINSLFAFEQPFTRVSSYYAPDIGFINSYVLAGNPAGEIYSGNAQYYRLKGVFLDAGYRRAYDPAATQLYNAEYTAIMQAGEKSFFSASISYEDQRLREVFGSMDKDFYDDYFSMVDSTVGNVAFYGPQLRMLYNKKLAEGIFFGLEGNYGIERSLKDTFPQTITVMRNSEYVAGLEFRGESASLGIFGRYYDNQVHYEAVKKYTDVKPRTYFGYNVYYNELATATINKKRMRKGLEYGVHFRLGKQSGISAQMGVSGLHRVSAADAIRGSYTHKRGVWQRDGFHAFGIMNFYPEAKQTLRLYSEHLRYSDWAASRISNTVVAENEERFSSFGALFLYRSSLAMQVFVAAEMRNVSYDYSEYIFPFHDARRGWEWKVNGGGRLYLSSKTRLAFELEYGKEIPRFYWDSASFENLRAIISLEKLFPIGYIILDAEYLLKTPEEITDKIHCFLVGLSYCRK